MKLHSTRSRYLVTALFYGMSTFFLTVLPAMNADAAVGGEPGPTPKVTICHIPPGNPGNAHFITIAEAAVPAHQAHGDPDPGDPCPEVVEGEPPDEVPPADFTVCDTRTGETGRLVEVAITGQPSSRRTGCN
ncbi:MAG: hypothetical protein ACT4NU_13400 [Chromatiales bacterium]